MKRFIIFNLLLVLAASGTFAQRHFNVGGGYFGHTLTHPGLVVEVEWEQMYTEKASLPLFVGAGAYLHPRNHYGVFLEAGAGLRQYLPSGLFFEERMGLGVLQTFLHSDAVYEVDESGQVNEGSRSNQPDFMPSVSLGLGYNFSQGEGKQNLLWIRPKLYFQMPHKTFSNYHLALQVGYTFTLRSR
jgi:hypothetical protein